MNITVYGAGYVGLVTATCFAELGHKVLCVDIDPAKIKLLQKGKVPYYEPGLSALVQNNIKKQHLFFSSQLAQGCDFSQLQFICVGTPSLDDGSADTTAVFSVVETIINALKDFKIIINKSTVPVGTNKRIEQFCEKVLKQKGEHYDFAVVSNPEFLQEGKAVYNFMHPQRVIIGTQSDEAAQILQKLYEPLCDEQHPFIRMDPISCELTKYTANAMLATKISFMNEIANLAELVGADIKAVEEGIAYDPRIGPDFIHAGCGYGGSCFPKDVQALIHTAKENSYEPILLASVHERNNQQRQRLFYKINKHYKGNLAGKTFALWGLAFKPETDDMREASSCYLLDKLLAAKARIKAYDPIAIPTASDLYGERNDLQFCNSADACLENADGLILVTEWQEFYTPNFALLKAKLKQAVIFDGRNLYNPQLLAELGFQYYGIGRGAI